MFCKQIFVLQMIPLHAKIHQVRELEFGQFWFPRICGCKNNEYAHKSYIPKKERAFWKILHLPGNPNSVINIHTIIMGSICLQRVGGGGIKISLNLHPFPNFWTRTCSVSIVTFFITLYWFLLTNQKNCLFTTF